jgi:hypothetical protein
VKALNCGEQIEERNISILIPALISFSLRPKLDNFRKLLFLIRIVIVDDARHASTCQQNTRMSLSLLLAMVKKDFATELIFKYKGLYKYFFEKDLASKGISISLQCIL